MGDIRACRLVDGIVTIGRSDWRCRRERSEGVSDHHEKLRDDGVQGIYESNAQEAAVEIVPELAKDTTSSD